MKTADRTPSANLLVIRTHPPMGHGCDTLPERGVFDKSRSGPASSVRRLVIEAMVTV